MQIGLIGAGNMARALARGWAEPVLCCDSGSGRAAALAAEVGGEALPTPLEVARRSDLVVLCHKPHGLEEVAAAIRSEARAIASVLGATPVAALQAAYPATPVFRLMPNTPVEVRRGITCYCRAEGVDATLEATVLELFGRVGDVVVLPERQMEAATAMSGVGPAYWALLAEAQVDAAVRQGLPAQLAGRLVAQTMGGTAELLHAREHDTLRVRREVTSPGGSTARGLAALERAGVRSAFQQAADAVAGTGR